jgi:hypothetical protein
MQAAEVMRQNIKSARNNVKEGVSIQRNSFLHVALYVAIKAKGFRLFVTLLDCADARAITSRLRCLVLLASHMHGYLHVIH